jgi:chemotaxis protein methyltransferase WspC
MNRIEQLLRQTIGLDVTAIGRPLMQRAIRLRMRSVGVRAVEDYILLICRSRTEWNELVESLLVAETWFFREPEQFEFVVRFLFDEWLPRHRTEPFRILSVPCSSGEEPYSVVMALCDAGFSPERLWIDAADISAWALDRASRGIYRKNSFRGENLRFRDRWFQACREGFVLDSTIRSAVTFHAGNLLSDDFLDGKAGYDCILCRNLLIYFDPVARQQALEKIERLLNPGGVLLVGAAEQALAIGRGFVPFQTHKAFAFRKGTSHATDSGLHWGRIELPKAPPVLHGTPSQGETGEAAALPPGALEAEDRKVVETANSDLQLARRLADAGCLQEAARICEAHLRKYTDSAEGYYLLGLVREAGGDTTAIDCYRKALYLEPNHYESLLQMALLSQKNGDTLRAQTYRNRAQRIRTCA